MDSMKITFNLEAVNTMSIFSNRLPSTNGLATRKGGAAVLLCVLMAPLLLLLAFSIDYGFLLFVETNLQRTADQAALAAARDLVPDEVGNQDLNQVRETVRQYVKYNLGDEYEVLDDDIEIGRYNPATVYSNFELLNNGTLDAVRVTIRRNDSANGSVSLYFARLFGNDRAGVVATSTAVMQKGKYIGPGANVFPFAIEEKAWNRLDYGETASIYGDGRIEDETGKKIPGNWGTVDIGPASNSTASLSYQIRNGLSQNDLDALEADGRIATNEYIDANVTIDLNGDTGLSAGLRHAIDDVEGQTRIAPVYKKTSGGGGGLEFEIVGWVSLKVVDSRFHGSKNTYVEVQKAYTYDENLRPVSDLSNTSDVIEGAYTSSILVQ